MSQQPVDEVVYGDYVSRLTADIDPESTNGIEIKYTAGCMLDDGTVYVYVDNTVWIDIEQALKFANEIISTASALKMVRKEMENRGL